MKVILKALENTLEFSVGNFISTEKPVPSEISQKFLNSMYPSFSKYFVGLFPLGPEGVKKKKNLEKIQTKIRTPKIL
jgi:hypothetical protein